MLRRANHFAFVNLICSCWSLCCCTADGCPANCTCEFVNSKVEVHPDLWISCSNRQAAEPPDTDLTRDINAMLANNTDINELYITNSLLTLVPEKVSSLTSLQLLIIESNRLVALPDNCLTRLSRLVEFSARNNRIAYIQDGLFDGLMFLEEIDLSNNSIESIGLRVFSNASDLPRLKKINLSDNKLKSLEPWPIVRGQAQSRNYQELRTITGGCAVSDDPVIVNLYGNAIQSLTNTANWTYDGKGRTDYFWLSLCLDNVPVTEFIDKYLTVDGELPCFLHRRRSSAYGSLFDSEEPLLTCALLQIYNSFSTGAAESKALSTKLASATTLNSYEVYVYRYGEFFSGHFLSEHFINFIKHFNKLQCHISSGCPGDCNCFATPYNSTLHVLCAGVGLKEAPLVLPHVDSSYIRYLHDIFRILRSFQRNVKSEHFKEISKYSMPDVNTTYLEVLQEQILRQVDPALKYDYDVSDNNLTLLEARPYFKNTSILNASNSSIENISVEALMALQKADKIYLHDNLLTTLPRAVTTMNFSFSSFSLHNNPLDCSCGKVWLKNWVTTIRDRLENSEGILCDTPPRLHGKSILLVTDADFCYVPPPDARVIASVIVALLVCIAIVILLLRIFRVESYKRFRFHPFDRDECMDEEMTYDVFISFAHEDKRLAMELLEFLENNGCKACFHQRDFMAGESIMDNIVEGIQRSKRVLCLVTANFLQSTYCLEEFSIAQTRNVELKKRRLIIMKYKEFDIDTQVDSGRMNEDKEKSQFDRSGEVESQQLIPLKAFTQQREGKALALKDFVTRHTFINLSAADSWRDQLLYAMPIRRLGQVAPPAGRGDNN